MVETMEIVGKMTDAQKQKDPEIVDIIEQKGKNYRVRKCKQFEQEQRSYNDKMQPFCYRCAKKDLEALQAERYRDPRVRKQYSSEREVEVIVNTKQYSDPKRFKTLSDTEKKEIIRMGESKITAITTFRNFQCLTCGAQIGCEVSIPVKQKKELLA